jgi:hypothetical protein
MKKIIVLLFVLVLIAGCAPVAEAIQAAAVQTKTAEPTITPTPDVRVIKGDPFDYLLKREDLPKEGKYYVPDGGMAGRTNEEMIADMTVEVGRKYVLDTGRIMGWFVYFYRGSQASQSPQEVYCSVEFYKTSSGALYAGKNYIPDIDKNRFELKIVNESASFGDSSYSYEIFDTETQRVSTRGILFVYKNVWIWVYGRGTDSDSSWEFIESLANIELAKLQAAPLTTP